MVSKIVKVTNEQGMHMRPATVFSAAVTPFDSDVKIKFNGTAGDNGSGSVVNAIEQTQSAVQASESSSSSYSESSSSSSSSDSSYDYSGSGSGGYSDFGFDTGSSSSGSSSGSSGGGYSDFGFGYFGYYRDLGFIL